MEFACIVVDRIEKYHTAQKISLLNRIITLYLQIHFTRRNLCIKLAPSFRIIIMRIFNLPHTSYFSIII